MLSGCQLNIFAKKSGLQVSSYPESNVIVNGKSVGKTPYYVENMKPGEITVQLTSVTDSQNWEGKVVLAPGTLTHIHRDYGSTPEKSHLYTLSFEKLSDPKGSSVNIVSFPSNATFSIDGKPSGFSPSQVDVIPGPKVFSFSSPGYQDKIVNATVVQGYALKLNVTMAVAEITPTPTPTPSATPSATPTPTTGKTTITPLPKQSTSSANLTKPYIEILSTPTGWLKVRETPSTSGTELSKVNPGDTFKYKESTTSGWYNIEYVAGEWGYVSSQYAKIIK